MYFNPRSPRGERQLSSAACRSDFDFNPRSPRGERRRYTHTFFSNVHISIHAPREGSDYYTAGHRGGRGISIHAPREGSDDIGRIEPIKGLHFNPRSPRGERPSKKEPKIGVTAFQSTLPARGATRLYSRQYCRQKISIHAPREGSDR